jgi:hypothetical protein
MIVEAGIAWGFIIILVAVVCGAIGLIRIKDGLALTIGVALLSMVVYMPIRYETKIVEPEEIRKFDSQYLTSASFIYNDRYLIEYSRSASVYNSTNHVLYVRDYISLFGVRNLWNEPWATLKVKGEEE